MDQALVARIKAARAKYDAEQAAKAPKKADKPAKDAPAEDAKAE